jgi:hypothetical protein
MFIIEQEHDRLRLDHGYSLHRAGTDCDATSSLPPVPCAMAVRL